jgi:hypothetical protein
LFNPLVEEIFWGLLAILKVQLFFEKFINLVTDWVKILALFDENKLDL